MSIQCQNSETNSKMSRPNWDKQMSKPDRPIPHTKVTATGKVLALSHIFRMANGSVFFIELLSDFKLVHILVNIDKYPSWLKLIEHGATYSVSHLYHKVLWVETDNTGIDVLVVTSKSELELKNLPDSEYLRNENKNGCSGTLITYQGIITEIIDERLGLYKLNKCTTLVVSYLMGLVAEFSEDKKQSIRVGDQVFVFNAHKIKAKDDSPILVCCGRSFVKTKRLVQKKCPQRNFSDICIIHCIHKYNLGINFFLWLTTLEKLIISCANPIIPKEAIVRREYNEKKSILLQFIKKLADFNVIKTKSRSLLEEFLLNKHSCAAIEDFQAPFCPILIEQMTNNQKAEETLNNGIWKSHVINRKQHNWVIFGFLKLNEEGCIQLETNSDHIIVIVLETKHNIYNKLDNFVAIINFDWIEEKFYINELEIDIQTKKYIIVLSTNILNLVPRSLKNSSSCSETSNYELKILFKSGLYFNCHESASNFKSDPFFICNASITNFDASRMENWKALICFKGNFAKFYPCISDKTVIKGIVPSDVGGISFKKKHSMLWLTSMNDYLETIECVDLPTNFYIKNMDIYDSSSSCTSILDIIEGTCVEEIVSVEGWVVKRCMVSPTFGSEKLNFPSTLLDRQIGIPGSKTVQLYLQDIKNHSTQICVYLNSGTDRHIQSYPLGIIPGVKLRLVWLKRIVSKKKNIYLSATKFTSIYVISQITSGVISTGTNFPRSHRKFISQIPSLEPSSIVTILATISCVKVVELKTVCSACESDFKNGVCEYIGCHATLEGVLAGSAKFTIDDGTGVATVHTKDLEHIKLLSSLTSQQWNTFVSVAKDGLSFSSKRVTAKLNDIKANLNIIFQSSQILRPLILTCRTFSQNSNFSPSLFLLEIRTVTCNSDWNLV